MIECCYHAETLEEAAEQGEESEEGDEEESQGTGADALDSDETQLPAANTALQGSIRL